MPEVCFFIRPRNWKLKKFHDGGWSNFLIPKIAIIEGEKFCGAIKAGEFGYIIGLDFFGYSDVGWSL